MSRPFLTVVIPCYKTAATMMETIDSILTQSVPAEIILVNDGSPDETRDIALSYKEQLRYFEQPNGGVASARNLGLKEASGEFVLFLDADDAISPGMVDAFREGHRERPSADVLYSNLIVADEEMKFQTVRNTDDIRQKPLTHLLCQNRLMPQSSIIRTDLLRSIAGFDVALNGVDDWDIWVRLAEAGAEFLKLDFALSVWRTRAGSQSRQFFHTWDGHRAFFRKHRNLYRAHTTRSQREILLNHIMDRDLPHLYGNDLAKSWTHRRLNRIGKFLLIVAKAPDLTPILLRRMLSNLGAKAMRVKTLP